MKINNENENENEVIVEKEGEAESKKEDGPGGGHEGIRPTDIEVTKEDVPDELQSAYDIVWKHAVASVCSAWEGYKYKAEWEKEWFAEAESTKPNKKGWK